jgi:cytidyltransferase-like protein
MEEGEDTLARREFCAANGIQLRVVDARARAGFPDEGPTVWQSGSPRPKVVVTGCFDWLHSGHARFFEEVAGLGELYVVVGSDANVRLLKGEGHPLRGQAERRYMTGAVRTWPAPWSPPARGGWTRSPRSVCSRPTSTP